MKFQDSKKKTEKLWGKSLNYKKDIINSNKLIKHPDFPDKIFNIFDLIQFDSKEN